MASPDSNKFQRAVAELQEQLDKCNVSVNKKDNCFSSLVVIGVITPIILFLMLYFVQPGFVTSEQGGKRVRDKKKVFFWTIGVTLLVWASLYFYAYYNNYTRLPMICAQ